MGFFDIFKSADSFWEMGENCFYGRNGASKDHEMAREYYEKALKKGTTKSMQNLIAIYVTSAESIKKNQKRFLSSAREMLSTIISQSGYKPTRKTTWGLVISTVYTCPWTKKRDSNGTRLQQKTAAPRVASSLQNFPTNPYRKTPQPILPRANIWKKPLPTERT